MNLLANGQNIYQSTTNQTAVSNTATSNSETGFLAAVIIFYVFVFLIGILIHFLAAYLISATVVEKGYTLQETHALAKCFWLGVIGYIYVLGLPNRKLLKQNQLLIMTLQKTAQMLSKKE
jgi:uncharacterized membrane protein